MGNPFRRERQVVVVTGANSGIGFDELARKGADMILACRSEARGKEAEREIREALGSTPGAGSVEFKMLNVTSLGSVRKFADEFKATHDRLDLLINSAGVMAVPDAKAVDGYYTSVNSPGSLRLDSAVVPVAEAKHSSACGERGQFGSHRG
ncbi:hypothetical protein ON010_g8670 [Phytophthora cinnamomi]|nr:hypothetical protein ON010_g8670 [Phytophthora cinnamomi]